MKLSQTCTLVVSLLALAACGSASSTSAVKAAPALPTGTDSQGALTASTLHLGRIASVSAGQPDSGKINVTVTYLRSCGDRFETLVTTLGRPVSLANPHIVVGAVMSSPGPKCEAADVTESATFQLDNIVGVYGFEKMQPGFGLNAYHPADITAIVPSAGIDAPVDVQVTYTQTCGDAFIGLLTPRVSPESLANPHVGVLALVKNRGILCEADAVPATVSFTMPALHGVYSFLPVLAQR